MVEEKLKKTKIDGEAAKRQQTTQTTKQRRLYCTIIDLYIFLAQQHFRSNTS